MSTAAATTGPLQLSGPGRASRALRWTRMAARKEPAAVVSVVVLLIVLFLCLFGESISGKDASEIIIPEKFARPGGEHWFGTDNLGRDIFARVAVGGQSTLRVAFVASGLGAIIGITLGVVAAFYGRWVDLVLSRVIDSMLAVPAILLAMILVLSVQSRGWSIPFIAPKSELATTLAIGLIEGPRVARVARAATISVINEQYVLAARSIGASDMRIMIWHLLPQTMNSIIVLASSILGAAIIIDASLGFVGLGRPPTDPAWGAMLTGAGRNFLETAWWIALFPGLAIMVTVLAFNLLGDSLRALLDPRARER